MLGLSLHRTRGLQCGEMGIRRSARFSQSKSRKTECVGVKEGTSRDLFKFPMRMVWNTYLMSIYHDI